MPYPSRSLTAPVLPRSLQVTLTRVALLQSDEAQNLDRRFAAASVYVLNTPNVQRLEGLGYLQTTLPTREPKRRHVWVFVTFKGLQALPLRVRAWLALVKEPLP